MRVRLDMKWLGQPGRLLGFLLAVGLLSALPADLARAQTPSAAIVFDATNSMWGQIDGDNKVVLARKALARGFERAEDKLQLAVLAFGNREENSCQRVETIVPLGDVTPSNFNEMVNSVTPAKGATPLALALEQAAQQTNSADPNPSVIVISDGLDNCRRDPCVTATALKQQMPGLRIHVIALGESGREQLQDLSCISDATGGTFFPAATRGALNDAVLAAIDLASQPDSNSSAGPGLVARAPANTTGAGETTAALPDTPPSDANTTIIAQTDPTVPPMRPPQPAPDAAPMAPSPAVPPAGAADHEDNGNGVSTLRKIQNQIESESRAGLGTLRLAASLTSDSPTLQNGLIWRIFSTKPDDDGSFKVIARSEDAEPVFELAANQYIVHAAYGRANATREVTVAPGNTVANTVVLNAGGLRLTSVLPGGRRIPDHDVTYAIYAAEQDALGERKLIFPSAEPGKIIRLNAGNYHVVSQYGDANAVVRANVAVQAGRLSEAVVNHSAAKITLKLVNEPGGEALANTSWSILTPEGDVVAESIGAFPSHILAAGTYTALARHEGKAYNKDFSVQAGLDQEIELVGGAVQ